MGCMRGRRLISDESSETSRRGPGWGLSGWAALSRVGNGVGEGRADRGRPCPGLSVSPQ